MNEIAKSRKLWWGDYPATAYKQDDLSKTIAILPVAAIEQHGPHLPLCTDTAIMEGMLSIVAELLPGDLDVRFLPIQSVGKSDEHVFAPGTLSLSAPLLIECWKEIGRAVCNAGIQKLVIVNSHGGNNNVMEIVARALRVECDMFVVKTNWLGFGHPSDIYTQLELRDGIHGGDVETSLMLHFRPDLVDMGVAENFPSINDDAVAQLTHLRPTGPHSFAWRADDLHPAGVVGNAAAATADKGAATAQWEARAFLELLNDVRKVDITHFLNIPGDE